MGSSIPMLNEKFVSKDKLKTDISLDSNVINTAVVHQVIKAILAGRRQGNACVKTRAQVRGGGKKPFKQKGTGRARQGSTRSPLLVGGGVTFGPSPRDYTQKVNKKMMRNAIQSVLADKFQAGKLTVVEKIESSGKTKEMFTLLNGKGLLPALIVVSDKSSPALRAVRNLRQGKGMAVEGLSVYEMVKFENLVIEKKAMEEVLKRLEA
ncbi:MAG: 50S ribosomal protein L4 [Halobacteriovoraceae bacterium]|nr:50S ribosomal protein L4 [Halobacteriovoraceae bacterium]